MKKASFLLYFLLLYWLCFLVFYYDLSVLSEFGAPGNDAAAAALEIRRFLRRRTRLAEALLRLVMTQDLQWFLATIVVLRLPC